MAERGEAGSRPVPRPGGPRWLRKLSLKTRLIAAFTILIVTSASATIGIGNAVFGRRVVELAASTMAVNLRVAHLRLAERLDRLRAVAALGAGREDAGDLLAAEPRLEFLLETEPGGTVLRRPGAGVSPATPPRGELADFLAAALSAGEARSGFLVLPEADLAGLGYDAPPPAGLLLAAAAPAPGGGARLCGWLLSGRSDLMAADVALLWPEGPADHAISVFLGERRVASSMGARTADTRADPAVLRRVLQGGRPYTGAAQVLGGGWYAAYEPLRDWRGEAVGILGVGGREAAYADLRRQTVTLFAGLIALGMIFGFIMTYTFSGLLIRPVADLAEGMHRVAHGDLGYKVRIESADELGKLATAFNRMVRAIRQRDIRLREMTEERLSQVEKQVSIGRLAAGVAHEINNPLTSILSLSMLALRELDEDDPRREDLQIVVEETDRCREIVRALLDFARERTPESRRVDLNQVIRDTLVLTDKYEGMERLRVILKLTDEPLMVHGDPKQLQQVFTNLITNAAGAVGAGGDVTISSDEDSSGGYAVVRVMDTGKGIRQEDLDRVFEPFFTTKAGGRGTGLGLSVSLGIVRKHDGTIEIESEEGYGTTVSVYLPRDAEGGEGRS